jgi:acyl-CoA synthetase (AMP-forming)/AMP-acid ligase II/acyl carrier protein
LRLVDWMAAERITICFLPTPVVALLLDGQWPPNLVLRALLTGGDRLPQRPQHQPLFDIVNHYGPTENTVVTTAAHVADSAEHSALPAIGKAIRNVQVYVLDPQMEPVPTGLPGELFIGGENLARGYLLRPSLTAQRFLPNPFSTQQGARMYRTGDLARYLPDGNLQFLGRTDQQVKIRGYRIELGEVEAALNGHPAVAEAVVLAREDTPADKRLVAYVVPKGSGDNLSAIGENGGNGLTPTGEQAWQLGRGHLASELLSYLHDKLPDYMIPTAYVLLDGLPLTPNGKVDRRALPPPEAGAQGQSEHYVAPRTRTEEAMAALWAGLLGVEGLGVENDFFMLGGHSLLAVQLIFAIQDTFGVELPLRNLFDTPTVRGLAQLIDELVKSDQTLQTPVIVPAPRTRYRADAPAQ